MSGTQRLFLIIWNNSKRDNQLNGLKRRIVISTIIFDCGLLHTGPWVGWRGHRFATWRHRWRRDERVGGSGGRVVGLLAAVNAGPAIITGASIDVGADLPDHQRLGLRQRAIAMLGTRLTPCPEQGTAMWLVGQSPASMYKSILMQVWFTHIWNERSFDI